MRRFLSYILRAAAFCAAAFLSLLPSTLLAAPGVIFVGCPMWGPGNGTWEVTAEYSVLKYLKGAFPSCDNVSVQKCQWAGANADGSNDYPNPYQKMCFGTACGGEGATGGSAVGYSADVFMAYPWTDAEGSTPPLNGYVHCSVHYGTPFHPQKNEGCGGSGTCKGDPVNLGTGNQFQRETDYPAREDGGLEYYRVYNSLHVGPSAAGLNWTHTWRRSMVQVATTEVDAYRPDGKAFAFNLVGSAWVGDPDNPETLSGSPSTGWTLTTRNNEVETYDASGNLLTLTTASGRTFTLTHADGVGTYFYQDPNFPNSFVDATSPSTPLTKGTLVKVTDFRGRTLQFYYTLTTGVYPWKLRDPDGNVYLYQYDSTHRLTSVTYPTSPATSRTYIYDELANTSNTDLPGALTGITDENGQRFVTFTYSASKQATSAFHAGNTDNFSFGNYATTSTTYVDPLGSTWTSQLAAIQGVVAVTQSQCTNCAGTPTESFTYDANRNTTSRKDFNGNLTCYSYDTTRTDLEISRTEGLSGADTCSAPQTTSATRTISTQWNPIWRAPDQVAEPLKITTYTHNGQSGVSCAPAGSSTALVCSKTAQATTDADGSHAFSATPDGTAAMTWSYTYNASGQLLTIDGPRTDVQDVTTLSYYGADDPSGNYKAGDLASTTDAKGHATQFTNYDGSGRLKRTVDPNGLETLLDYFPRGWLKSRQVGNAALGYETTTYGYDGVGNLTRVTMPDASFVTYGYDAAHRLTNLTDGLGNHIHYTLDAMGNRTQEDAYDPQGTLERTHSRVIDQLNRVSREIGGTNPALQVTQYAYDANGNVTSVTDPLNRVTTNTFDARNRLTQVVDPFNGPSAPTAYGYNGQDQLTQVIDPIGLATTYQLNGVGELASQVSPDTGSTAFTFDSASNIKTRLDARGVQATYSYDELNRPTQITYPDETVSYTYDTCANGVGRLCSVLDGAATTTYAYDLWGRVTSKTQAIGTQQQTIRYAYNAAGQLATVTMPSGHAVAYTYANGQPVSVAVDAQVVLDGVVYEPFGPNGGWRWGNSTTSAPNMHTRIFDKDFRATRITSDLPSSANQPYFDRQIGWDAQSRVQSITDLSNPSLSATYGYDALDRLTAVTQGASAWTYSFNGVGDRLAATTNGNPDTYTYFPASHRLQTVTGTQSRTFTFDAAGNATSDGAKTWSFGGNGRNKQVVAGAVTTSYAVNALGQRVKKTDSTGAATMFAYDERGHLVGEYGSNGSMIEETIWLGDLPVAVIR